MRDNKDKISPSDAAKIVFDTYEREAEDLIENGFRSCWWYIANKALSDWALLSLADIKGKDVLNIGCWEPIDEMVFARHVKSWTALDRSPKGIAIGQRIINRELSQELAKKISLVVGDARFLPFPDEHFDATLCFSTIEHIPDANDRMKVIKEMARVTKRGGICDYYHIKPLEHSLYVVFEEIAEAQKRVLRIRVLLLILRIKKEYGKSRPYPLALYIGLAISDGWRRKAQDSAVNCICEIALPWTSNGLHCPQALAIILLWKRAFLSFQMASRIKKK